MSEELRPKVANVVLILKEGKVLLGKRVGEAKDAGGMYGTPGGHMENLETFAGSAIREVKEEIGIEIENIQPLAITNVRQFAPRHYVLVILRADWKSGEPQTLEPHRCEGWEWFDPEHPPSPMTPATRDGLIALRTGQVFFEEDI